MRRWAAAAALVGIAATLLWRYWPRHEPDQVFERALHSLRSGDFAAAAAEAEGGERQTTDAGWRCRFRLLRSEALIENGRGDSALDVLKSGCETDSVEYRVRSETLRSRLLISKADLAGAQQLLQKAQEIATEAGRADLQAETALLQGQTFGRQRRLADAEKLFMKAYNAAAATGDRFRLAAAVNSVGMVRMLQSRCEEAIALFKEAQELYREADASHWAAAAANNTGMCYSQLGDLDSAVKYRQAAMELARPGALKANALGEAGTALLAEDPMQAAGYYKQARDMAREFGASSDAARWAGNLAFALTAAADWDGAQTALEEARRLGPEPRSRVFLDLTEASIAVGKGRTTAARSIFQRVIDSSSDNPAVLWRAHAGAAAASMAENDPANAARSYEEAIGVVEGGQSDLSRNEHKITYLARLIRLYQDYVDLLMSRNDVSAALAVADRSRARLLSERVSRPVGRQERYAAERFRSVAKSSGAVWLSYWLAPKRSFLWVVTSDDIRCFTLPGQSEIAALVRDYTSFIKSGLRDPMQTASPAGAKLYELLIEPAKDQIRRAGSIVLVPDGPLHHLSFDTLPVDENGVRGYLAELAITAITPAFAVFRRASPGHIASREALIIGDPVSPAPEYPALKHANREIAQIANHLQSSRTQVLTGDKARPAVWKTAEPGRFPIIHIAAHAEANERSPLDSAIILTNDNGYRLYARDIIEVPLRAELVSLSACRSSGARAYAGEGMVGFAWAFLHAGARSVMAGLWDVADEPALMLMDHLYKEIARGEAPGHALRSARLALRRSQYSKPYYWGAFQYYVR